ncbi:MAG: hypothetical protein PVJ86_00355 [Phycisphaerales bacterium]|jgi:hypothetical protein
MIRPVMAARRTIGGVLAAQYVAEEAFLPTDIAGLKLWLDADAIVGLNDGDPVASWLDQSGQGNHATQAAADQKPLYKTNIINGKPVVRFDGANDFFDLALPALIGENITSFSLIVIVKKNATVSQSIIWVDVDAGWFVDIHSNDKIRFYGLTNGTSWNIYSTGTISADAIIISAVYDGASAKIYFNGGQDPTSAAGSGTIQGDVDAWIGALRGGGRWLNSDLGDLLVYVPSISDANRESVESWASNKYNISLS